jgi:pyruvate dehydrogenase E2 component (dihydrolipoamide acetyltransferase)
MAETVTMPKLGFDMAEGILVHWSKKVGDPIQKGEVLAEIETDKATIEVESPYSGVVARYLVEQSTSVPVGDPIAIIAQPGEQLDAFPSTPEPVREKPLPVGWPTKELQPLAPISEPSSPSAGNTFASPLARKMARDNHLDLAGIHGTGPNGRVIRRDVEASLVSRANQISEKPVFEQPLAVVSTVGEERIPLNKLRQAIGRRMVEAKTSIPHFYVTHAYRVDRLVEMRKQFNEAAPEAEKLSVNDFIIKAVALTLREFPNLNASLSAAEVVHHAAVNIGSAVAVDGGLLTVVVRDAHRKTIRQISAEMKDLAGRVRAGKVRPADIEGSTFSISNLGMYDVEEFGAIINPPEAAILAVASAHPAPVVDNGEIKVGQILKATLSVDHRVSDGVEAARFLQSLAHYIENPLLMVM